MQRTSFWSTPVRLAVIGTLGAAVGAFQGGCSIKDADTQSSGSGGTAASGNGGGAKLSGAIDIDGSSTVFLISQAVAEDFQKLHPRVKVSVGVKGTGGGFERFTRGETDISDASRPIKDVEIQLCRKNGIEYVELPVGIDGLSVVVNHDNNWCRRITVDQLRKIWEPNSKVTKWNQVDRSWPDAEIRLYGPDTDSGTFDYFTEAICGKNGASRADYTPSADDFVLVRGVAGDRYSLGYFGYAYYVKNKDKLKDVAVSPTSDPNDAVAPTKEAIESGKYRPLSRPLFVYVKKESLKRPEVAAFLRFYLNEGRNLVSEVGYVRQSEAEQQKSVSKLEAAIREVSGG